VGTLVPALPRPSPVTFANDERISKGVTRAEVEAILGGPPGDYRTRIDLRRWPRFSPAEVVGADKVAVWHRDEVDVVVWSDSGGSVLASCFDPANADPMDLSDLIWWQPPRQQPRFSLRQEVTHE